MTFLKAGIATLGLLAGLTAHAELKTVSSVNVARYAGTWYEIARNNFLPFEWGCTCARQVLTPSSDGTVGVYNSCNFWSPQGKLREIRGTAEVADKTTNAKLTVDFNMPWKGDYWIIALDSDYRWAVVSEPKQWALYILSRTPTMDPAMYDEAIRQASLQVNTGYLQIVQQLGCSYP